MGKMGEYNLLQQTSVVWDGKEDEPASRLQNDVRRHEEDEKDDAEQTEHGLRNDHNGDHNNTALQRGVLCQGKVWAFWFMGLLNNSGYVIMLAAAKSISEGGTALVFLANVFPAMCVKLTAPYWFHLVSYRRRMMAAAIAVSLSFCLVGLFPASLYWQLTGVAFGSLQSGLGEATLLAFSGKLSRQGDATLLTAFSSGTGLAGVFGFAWVIVGTQVVQASSPVTVLAANVLSIAYGLLFGLYLAQYENEKDDDQDENGNDGNDGEDHDQQIETDLDDDPLERTTRTSLGGDDDSRSLCDRKSSSDNTGQELELSSLGRLFQYNPPQRLEAATLSSLSSFTVSSRFCRTLSLWPYMIPLFVVYAAEYALQSGTWTAIGFPPQSESSRAHFYEFSNWMYQVGVFISRSSGTLWKANMPVLWLMPALQCVLLVFFTYTALQGADSPWYHDGFLLPLCGVVGLLGGAVYVQGYVRITADFAQVQEREWALATVGVAESLGVLVADLSGLFLQSCIYHHHGLPGAVVSCPVS